MKDMLDTALWTVSFAIILFEVFIIVSPICLFKDFVFKFYHYMCIKLKYVFKTN